LDEVDQKLEFLALIKIVFELGNDNEIFYEENLPDILYKLQYHENLQIGEEAI
jgi:hypothetical protein